MENIFFPKMKKGTFFSLTSSGLGLEDYLPLLGYTYKWSKLELAGATFQDCSTPQNMTSCEGIRSLAPKKAPEPLKKPFHPQMLYTLVS